MKKYIATTLYEFLNEHQEEKLFDIDISKLMNLFIIDPVNFMKIFNINDNKIKLSLATAKGKHNLIKNWNDIHKNLKATIDGIDVSTELKELIYPSDTPKLINDTDNFLKALEKRVKARKYKSSIQDIFINPYGRISKTDLTPIKVINDFINNPQTEFNYSQYEYAKADLDLQLINFIRNGGLELKTTTITTTNDIKNDLINDLKNGLKGEELINVIDISSLRKFIEDFWKEYKKEIENKYIEAKNKGINPILVKTIENLKK